MDLTNIRDEITCHEQNAHPALKAVVDAAKARVEPLPQKILIVGNGPYDPHRMYGGKSFLVHKLMQDVWPGIEVEYRDLSAERAKEDLKDWVPLPIPEIVTTADCIEWGSMKPSKKVYGPNNHSKHRRQGRANRWR